MDLGIYTEGRQKFCAEICIYKRPGGWVPPSPVYDPTFYDVHKVRYHEFVNKWKDWMNFGIPRPMRK